jgi:hypothetical protein
VIVGRIIGAAFLLLALGAFGYEVYAAVTNETYRFVTAGEIWVKLDGNSLVGFQALIEKNVAPWLWSDIVLPVLLGPVWAIPLVPAVLLLWFCRRRRKRQRSFAH